LTIEAIVLAAGLSSRSHSYKMSLEINNKTVIQTCIENMYNIVDRVNVIGGYNFHILQDLLKDYSKVNLIYNDEFEDGMFSSVKLGINSVSTNSFFLIPGDYVLVRDDIYRTLLQYKSNKSIVIPTYEEKKGHPVLFKDMNIKSIINNNKFNNLRDLINDNGYETIDVHDDSILFDIDTFEDYKFIKEKFLLKYERRA
jgi:molybdenum cofactor cytidylyltransferase